MQDLSGQTTKETGVLPILFTYKDQAFTNYVSTHSGGQVARKMLILFSNNAQMQDLSDQTAKEAGALPILFIYKDTYFIF